MKDFMNHSNEGEKKKGKKKWEKTGEKEERCSWKWEDVIIWSHFFSLLFV